ncbi:MAG TPA: Fur family transcriptional regulator [Thermoanaerobaculia bacterium]|nr:Fur family transcriptional regulator [Thermoanaerobaculia bacterium]
MPQPRERQQFLDYLHQQGMRVTRERMVLFDEIFARHGHIDAEDLLTGMQSQGLKISRATVYRNLDLLVECGLVRKYRLGRNHFLFEHIHAGQQHDHLVCTECGRVVEFVSPGIAALQTEICRAHGFVPDRHTLHISSLCNECAEAEREAEAAEDSRSTEQHPTEGSAHA